MRMYLQKLHSVPILSPDRTNLEIASSERGEHAVGPNLNTFPTGRTFPVQLLPIDLYQFCSNLSQHIL